MHDVARVSCLLCVGMIRFQDGGSNQCISVYTAIFITGKHPAASKSTGSSLYTLPQYTVALRLSKSNSKMAYLKRSKSRIVHLLFFFSN